MSKNERIASPSLCGFEQSEDPGCFEIAERRFEDTVFSEISVGPGLPPDLYFRIRNVHFHRCKLQKGAAIFRGGVELINVEFDSFYSRESVTISTSAVIDNVVFKGSTKSAGLWVRPDEVIDSSKHLARHEWSSKRSSETSVLLDFAELDSLEVEVIGLPLEKLKYNPERHFAVRSDWRMQLDLATFPVTGFVRSALRRLKTYAAREGVFAAPRPRDDGWSGFCDELLRISDAGIDVSARNHGPIMDTHNPIRD